MGVLIECLCHRKQSLRNKVCSCSEDLVKLKRANKVNYWITYRLPGGKQKREVVGTSIDEARDADGKRRVQKRENRIFDIRADAKMTFQELTDWYLCLESVKALKAFNVVETKLKIFNQTFGKRIVFTIKPSELENYQAKRKKIGRADATVDMEMVYAKAVINKAFRDNLVGGETLKAFMGVKRLLKGNSTNARKIILSKEQFDLIMGTLPYFAKGIILMGFYTGMRRTEMLRLTWDKISLEKRTIELEARDTKTKRARVIPMSNELYSFLKRLPRAIGSNRVFIHNGRAIGNDLLRVTLIRACKDVGVIYGRFAKDGFILHDLRHSFNTYMRKAGVAESVIMECTGHLTRTMFDRYNTVDDEDKRKAVEKLEDFLHNSAAKVDQNVDQNVNS